MSYTIHYEEFKGQGLGVRAYIGWGGKFEREPVKHGNVMYVHRTGDGCITIYCQKNYFYPGEADAISKALTKLRSDFKSDRKKAQREWLAKTKTATEFEGFKVDLSRAAVQKILKDSLSTVINGRLSVLYNGEWHELYRTDLKDDVGTFSEYDSLEYYRKKARNCFGARLRAGGIGIVDSYSDG